jgi:hypothetical protein
VNSPLSNNTLIIVSPKKTKTIVIGMNNKVFTEKKLFRCFSVAVEFSSMLFDNTGKIAVEIANEIIDRGKRYKLIA